MPPFDAAYTKYQLERSRLRRFVRGIYLRRAARRLQWKTIDFGCGVGDLLSLLPHGSVGLEINPSSVRYCRERNLSVHLYDADADGWSLSLLDADDGFRSLVISHVLEHLEQPMAKFHRLLQACARIGVCQVLAIVPGSRGFAIDPTHRTFVHAGMLSDADVVAGTGFRLRQLDYFPGNLRMLGDLFVHHELHALYERDGTLVSEQTIGS